MKEVKKREKPKRDITSVNEIQVLKTIQEKLKHKT